MAKKITDNDTAISQVQPDPSAGQEQASKTGAEPADEPEKIQTKQNGKVPAQTAVTDIPDYARKILKAFPDYPALFIDFSGGIFTVDTPPAFRGNATLYRNPYHKS